MTYSSSYPPILELAFFKKTNFRCFTSPDHIFMIKDGGNGPPVLSLSLDGSNALNQGDVVWTYYDGRKFDWGTNYDIFPDSGYFHQGLLGLCLLMLGLYVEKDGDIRMVAKGFSKRIVDTKSLFDPYRDLDYQQLHYLLGMARKGHSQKYFVLSYCRQGINIIQDVQKETAGMRLLQYRYEALDDVLNQQ